MGERSETHLRDDMTADEHRDQVEYFAHQGVAELRPGRL
jgi:hypothetical protein